VRPIRLRSDGILSANGEDAWKRSGSLTLSAGARGGRYSGADERVASAPLLVTTATPRQDGADHRGDEGKDAKTRDTSVREEKERYSNDEK
jgi:hypothetical protein